MARDGRDETVTERDRVAPGLAVHCTGSETAPGVLLVHGWGSAARTFDALAARLAERYRVIVPDLRGHGATPAGPDPRRWAVSAMVDDLEVLVRSVPRPLVAVGHSLGGQMVSTLAARHDGPCLRGEQRLRASRGRGGVRALGKSGITVTS
jgi:pimeloyl-ACP methyl ester carboxylesterase